MHTLCTRVRVGVEAARRKARRLGIVCAYSADSVTARAPGSYSYTMLHTPSGWRGRIRYTRLPRRGVALFSRFTSCKCIKSISFVRSGAARPHQTPVQSAVRCDAPSAQLHARSGAALSRFSSPSSTWTSLQVARSSSRYYRILSPRIIILKSTCSHQTKRKPHGHLRKSSSSVSHATHRHTHTHLEAERHTAQLYTSCWDERERERIARAPRAATRRIRLPLTRTFRPSACAPG